MSNLEARAMLSLDHHVLCEIELKYKDDPFVLALCQGVRNAKIEAEEASADLLSEAEGSADYYEGESATLSSNIEDATAHLKGCEDMDDIDKIKTKVKRAMDELC